MRHLNQSSHISFIARELKKLLPDGSFASRLWRTIGRELHYRLVECPPDDGLELSRCHPVDVLFIWVSKDTGLDLESLASEDGNYLDDDGEVIPPTVKPLYSGIEQLAAYGLWLIKVKMNSYGPPAERAYNDQGWNPRGWTKEDVSAHQAPYMFLAYQALSYSQRILLGTQLSIEETEKATQFDFSALGKAGADKRHAPMRKLRAWAVQLYLADSWQSANHAAYALKESVIAYGRTINAPLSEQNAQRTIAEWFNKSV